MESSDPNPDAFSIKPRDRLDYSPITSYINNMYREYSFPICLSQQLCTGKDNIAGLTYLVENSKPLTVLLRLHVSNAHGTTQMLTFAMLLDIISFLSVLKKEELKVLCKEVMSAVGDGALPSRDTGPVAQWMRHLTTNQGIPGSSDGGVAQERFPFN